MRRICIPTDNRPEYRRDHPLPCEIAKGGDLSGDGESRTEWEIQGTVLRKICKIHEIYAISFLKPPSYYDTGNSKGIGVCVIVFLSRRIISINTDMIFEFTSESAINRTC